MKKLFMMGAVLATVGCGSNLTSKLAGESDGHVEFAEKQNDKYALASALLGLYAEDEISLNLEDLRSDTSGIWAPSSMKYSIKMKLGLTEAQELNQENRSLILESLGGGARRVLYSDVAPVIWEQNSASVDSLSKNSTQKAATSIKVDGKVLIEALGKYLTDHPEIKTEDFKDQGYFGRPKYRATLMFALLDARGNIVDRNIIQNDTYKDSDQGITEWPISLSHFIPAAVLNSKARINASLKFRLQHQAGLASATKSEVKQLRCELAEKDQQILTLKSDIASLNQRFEQLMAKQSMMQEQLDCQAPEVKAAINDAKENSVFECLNDLSNFVDCFITTPANK